MPCAADAMLGPWLRCVALAACCCVAFRSSAGVFWSCVAADNVRVSRCLTAGTRRIGDVSASGAAAAGRTRVTAEGGVIAEVEGRLGVAGAEGTLGACVPAWAAAAVRLVATWLVSSMATSLTLLGEGGAGVCSIESVCCRIEPSLCARAEEIREVAGELAAGRLGSAGWWPAASGPATWDAVLAGVGAAACAGAGGAGVGVASGATVGAGAAGTAALGAWGWAGAVTPSCVTGAGVP